MMIICQKLFLVHNSSQLFPTGMYMVKENEFESFVLCALFKHRFMPHINQIQILKILEFDMLLVFSYCPHCGTCMFNFGICKHKCF
jgi:hypothetical protein